MTNKTGLRDEILSILADGAISFEGMKQKLLAEGEDSKKLSDALYKMKTSGIIEKNEYGFIFLVGKSDHGEKSEVESLTESINSLEVERRLLQQKIENLEAEIGFQDCYGYTIIGAGSGKIYETEQECLDGELKTLSAGTTVSLAKIIKIGKIPAASVVWQ